MFVRIIELTLHIQNALTLKDKRQVLQSLTTRLRHKFNISVAEVKYQEQWQLAGLGIAFVSNRQAHLDSIQQELCQYIEGYFPVEITETAVSNY